MIKGKQLVVYIGLSAIAASKECTLEVTTDTKEVSSKTSGTDRTLIAGMTEWNVSCSGLVATNIDTLLEKVKSRTKISIKFAVGSATYSGYAFATRLQVSGKVGNISTYQVKFAGSGSLDKETISV